MNKKTVFIIPIAIFCISLNAQIPDLLNAGTKAKAQSELSKRGITEQELADKLAEKGIYLSDINNLSAEEAVKFQFEIQQAIAELQAEKNITLPVDVQFKANDPTVRRPRYQNDTILPGQQQPTSTPVKGSGKAVVDEDISNDSIPYVPVSKTSKTTSTQSSIKAQPLDLSGLIYGQEIFKNKSVETYTKSENIKPPDTYLLGVGDIVNIHIFGRSRTDYKNIEINPKGYIQLGPFPRIYIKGLTYEKARQVVRQTLQNYFIFEPNEFEMTIDYSREIGVNIYGEAEQIGTFNMPATNTVFNALVAAKGPNKIGSVRNIKLIRGKNTRIVDVYQFINNPAIAQDFYLEQGDIIHIPIADRVVSITGAVRRPLRYELLPSEQLMKLIDYAGGLREDAYKKTIQIKRYLDDKTKIIDVPLTALLEAKQDFALMSGDEVSIKTIPAPFQMTVSIDGQVDLPGTYEYKDGMHISDLLDKGKLKFGAKTDLAFMLRLNIDGTFSVNRINIKSILESPGSEANILLKPQDKLTVYALSAYIDAASISASGAIRRPVNVAFDPARNYRVSDLIILGGGLQPDALDFGYIKRINKDNYVERDYILFNTKKAIENPGGKDDIVLEPNDEVYMYNDRSFFDQTFVMINGAVRHPGTFAYGPGVKLKDIVILAGGFKQEAATNRIEVFRVVFDENRPTKTIVATLTLNRDVTLNSDEANYELKPFDQIQVRTVPQFELQQNVTVEGAVQFPGQYALIKRNETILDLLRRSGGYTEEAFINGVTLYRSHENTGYIIFRLDKALKNPRSEDNLILKEGDKISIPKIKDYISIEGLTDAKELYEQKLIASNNRINVAFVPNKNAKYYVDEFAAGVSKDGSRARITVEQPNGRIQKTKNFFLFKVYPKVEKGSVVKVGPHPPQRVRLGSDGKPLPKRAPINWQKTITDIMSQGTAVLSFILLVKTAGRL